MTVEKTADKIRASIAAALRFGPVFTGDAAALRNGGPAVGLKFPNWSVHRSGKPKTKRPERALRSATVARL